MILRRLLTSALTFFIAFPPHVMAALGSLSQAQSPPAGESKSAPIVDPEIARFIDNLESGQVQNSPNRDADIFHLTGQSIEIFDKGKIRSYDLNARQIEIPYVAFNALRIVYDKQNRQLFFDAYRGLDREGNNGVLVARQTIKNVDIAASAEDAELFQFVDSKLNMHAIDLGLVATQVFKAPIPIFQNLWVSSESASHSPPGLAPGMAPNLESLKSGYLTRGTTPQNLSQAVLLPHDQDGKVRLSAGDFYVAQSRPGSEDFAYAVFSRDTTYAQIARGYKILQWQAALLSNSTEVQAQVETIVSGLQNEIDKQELELTSAKISPQTRTVLSSLNQTSVKAWQSRESSMHKLKSGAFDAFSPSEWLSTFNEISKNIAPESSDKTQEQQWFKFINKMSADSLDMKKHAAVVSPHSKMKALRKAMTGDTGLRTLGIALGSLLIAAPYAYDQSDALQQIKVIAWSYEHFYPAVLRDAVYRTPLLLSIASLAAIWPEAVAFSAVTAKVLNAMAEKVKTETNAKAIYIKDLARNWGNINNWQRITSFGMRLYGWMILPYWRVLIEYCAQQKTFFSAVNGDLNPVQKILADSEIGRKLGLTEDQRIGLNQIFGTSKTEKIELNRKIQGAMVEENQKLDSIALLVSASLVAEKHKVDPALVLLLGKENIADLDVSHVSKVLDSPEKIQDWQMISQMLIKQMSETKKDSIVVDQHLDELITRYYKIGEQIMQKLDRMPELQKRFARFRLSFSSQMSNKLKAAANFAVGDHEFLKRVYTNEFVSGQVQKEFTIDHLMVIGIYGLYGERADLSHPEHLAADPNGFLWTSRAHWYDVFMNTFSHFFLSGASMALVFQKVKPQVAANYAPVEDYQYESRERTQGLWSATKEWAQVFDPIKSDLGGIIIKRLIKRTTTMTAGITMMLLLRVGIWNMSLHDALLAWSFNFITAQWFFAWIWDPVQRGNEMEGERLEEVQERLKVARRTLSRGDLEVGRRQMNELYAQYNPKVLELFELARMSGSEILMLSVDQPPVYTKANKWMSWITTWTAAVGSTVMAIPLSVILMDHKLLTAPRTWYIWVPISVAAYVGSYFFQARYAVKIRESYLDMRAKWSNRSATTGGVSVSRLQDENLKGMIEHKSPRSCEAAFAAAN